MCGVLAILFSALPLIGIVLGIVAIVLAGKALKQIGKNGNATGGKVCGIIGIVLSILIFLGTLLFSFGMAMYPSIAPNGSLTPGTEILDSPSSTLSESQPIRTALANELDKVKSADPSVVQALAADLDERFKEGTTYSMSELGIDPTEYASWMLTDFDYSISSAVDSGDGTGYAHAVIELRDSTAFFTEFLERLGAASDSDEIQGVDAATAKEAVGQIFNDAMTSVTDMTSDVVMFDMVKIDGVWQVDEDSWASEMDYLFELY